MIIKKPVPVYAPIDSYLILQSRYRMQGLKDVQWRLMFQVGCEIVYRFDIRIQGEDETVFFDI